MNAYTQQFAACRIDGCARNAHPSAKGARGWCSTHYNRWRRSGDPLGVRAVRGEPLQYFREVVLHHATQNCLLWPFARSSGYGTLTIDGRTQYVHRLVCEHVHGPAPSPDFQAAHSCGAGHLGCVSPGHLSWKTPAGNSVDKIEHGRTTRGERSASSKLTAEQVRTMRDLRAAGLPLRELSERFDIGIPTASQICSGKRWGWL